MMRRIRLMHQIVNSRNFTFTKRWLTTCTKNSQNSTVSRISRKSKNFYTTSTNFGVSAMRKRFIRRTISWYMVWSLIVPPSMSFLDASFSVSSSPQRWRGWQLVFKSIIIILIDVQRPLIHRTVNRNASMVGLWSIAQHWYLPLW